MQDATNLDALAYVGVAESEDVLEWHADLFLNQLSSLLELDEYQRSFPWRVAATLSAPCRAHVLEDMRLQWRFVLTFLDKLKPGCALHTQASLTRYQIYRDLMSKAENLNFKLWDRNVTLYFNI